MDKVEEFILEYPHKNTRELMLLTHQLLLDSIPQLQHNIKWKVPYYTYKKGFCYLNPKPKYLILGLLQGTLVSDPLHLLIGEQKLVRHYIIRTQEDIYLAGFSEILMEAILHNERL